MNHLRSMPSQHFTEVIEWMSADCTRVANWQPCSGTTLLGLGSRLGLGFGFGFGFGFGLG